MTFYQIARYYRAAVRREKAAKDEDGPAAEPSKLETFFSAGIPPVDVFIRQMTATFPGESSDHWRAMWEDAKRIEEEKALAHRDATGDGQSARVGPPTP